MDVHPPEHPILTKRDFFLHLFTITCGLLIALSLEALVEWGHHRALVREARENIRRELEANKKAAREDITSVEQDHKRFEANLETERKLRRDPKGHYGIQSTLAWSSLSDAAWRTARDTGALAFMPYAEVQKYADVYKTQDLTEGEAIRLIQLHLEVLAPMFIEEKDAPKGAELDSLLHDTALMTVNLQTLNQLLTQLRDQYTTVLNTK